MLNKLIGYYSSCLPPFLMNSIFFGYIVGMNTIYNGPMEMFENMIGYATYGVIFGLLYPISYPGCAIYILYKNLNID